MIARILLLFLMPVLAGAQTINVFWTLLLAWLLFGGVIIAQPVIQ